MFLDDLLQESFTNLLVLFVIYGVTGTALYLYWNSSTQPEFNKIILITAVFILLIMLTTYWYAIKNNKNSQHHPLKPPSCPDYWYAQKEVNSDGGVYNVCVPPADLTPANYTSYDKNSHTTIDVTDDNYTYDADNGTFNFNGSKWSGDTGLCNKYLWAKNNNGGVVAWDGITNQSSPC